MPTPNRTFLNQQKTKSKMAEHRDVYMNHKQQVIYYSGARDQRVRAARRFGKTDGTLGPQVVRVTLSMPQGAGIWAGNSRKQLFTRTVPATIAAIERFWGYKEGVQFWWGKPPKKLNIPRPIIKPEDWSHVISFFNGFVWYMTSLEVRGSANSMTVNYIMVDEARFIKKEKLDAEVMPTLSGITHPMADWRFSEANPYYKGTLFVSDAGLSKRDNWMDKEEEKCFIEIENGPFKGKKPIELQKQLEEYAERVIYFNELLRNAKQTGHNVRVVPNEVKMHEIKTLAEACEARTGAFRVLPRAGVNKQNVQMLVTYKLCSAEDAELLYDHQFLITKEEYIEMKLIKNSDSYNDHIRQLRCNTFAFYRANTLDNVDLLREDYIAKMKRDLPPVVFAISILNMNKQHSSDGFYSKLDIENVHGYVPQDCPAIEQNIILHKASGVKSGRMIETDYVTPDFGELQKVKNCTLDGDIMPDKELSIALDYNANINWVVTGQTYYDSDLQRDALHVLSSLFVKNERKLRELMKDWCLYYEPQRKRCRRVTYYYDTTAKFGAYAVANQQDFKDIVIEELQSAGWEVNAVDMGRPAEHALKHKDINESLAGIAYPFILINRENNESLVVAMENTGVKMGSRGFEKDKSKEKYVETEYDPLELRTDGTDAFDVLFMGEKYFRVSMPGICLPRRG